MDKYIKTEDLLDAIYPVDPENDGSDGCTVVAAPSTFTSEELEAMLDKIPAADVAPVIHARWVVKKLGMQNPLLFVPPVEGRLAPILGRFMSRAQIS